MKKISVIAMLLIFLTSCVSKKKFIALENDYKISEQNLVNTKGELQKTSIEKLVLEKKFAKIRARIDEYNTKINSLNDTNVSLNNTLSSVNNEKLVIVDDNNVILSNSIKDKMAVTLSKMSSDELSGANTLKDSLNLAIAYNLKKSLKSSDLNNDIDINIDKTVVMISVSDKMLFNSGSYRVKSDAYNLLQKLADIINSEPSMDVIIEGHTDSKSISTGTVKDNWDLSVKRATSIVRLLQQKYSIDPSRLIASGRSSYVPLATNDTKVGRARNRRTNIIILPNLNKFFALLESEEKIEIN